jgi:SAM-dependent methyltransferase
VSEAERRKWETRYQAQGATSREPSALITALDDVLPRQGHALDLAGGSGRHAIWLAKRGLAVTLADIAPTAADLARAEAARAGVSLDTLVIDCEQEPLPPSPWDLILTFHYLHRPLFETLPQVLAPGGWLVVVQPTQKNLERHAHPSSRFLLDEGELPNLVRDLTVVRYEEGWSTEGRHEALLVARRTDPA